MTIQDLYNLIMEQQRQIDDLKMRLDTSGEFQDNFSGMQIINHKVQFKQKVYDANGGVVTEINA